jgi:DNA repair protein SbcD/Mre11
VRLLHTSDWHVGKRLDRHDRMDEYRRVIDEVVAIAGSEQVDAVVHSGDLFDRAVPPVEALRLGLDGLVRLADGGRRPVVVVAGNHDSPALFDTLAPFLEPFGVHLVGTIRPPDEGGILSLDTPSGRLHAACFPFLRAAQTVDFMARADQWYGAYADRVRRLTEAYSAALGEVSGDDDVAVLVAHFMVGGVKVRTGIPRGERDLHIGEAYAATSQAVPTTVDYVALGHIHAPQPVPGAPVPAEYAGSLLQLDFGESGEEKRVVIVDAAPGAPASVRSVPLTGGKPLLRVEGRWEDIADRGDLDDAHLDLTVHTDGPDETLMDRVRERFPGVVKVRAEYERLTDDAPTTLGLTLEELYAAYHRRAHDDDPAPSLVELFREVAEEVADAAP